MLVFLHIYADLEIHLPFSQCFGYLLIADLSDSDDASYIPSSYESSSNESEIIPLHVTSSSARHTEEPIPGRSSDSVGSVRVAKSRNQVGGKRVWDKKYYCVFCKESKSKMARHLEAKHGEESLVCKALSFPKKSAQRRQILNELLKKGNFNHNRSVSQAGTGELVPVRRPQHDFDSNDSLTCSKCLGLYYRRDLWRHNKMCSGTKNGGGQSTDVQNRSTYLLPTPVTVSDQFMTDILSKMREDKVANICRKDAIIVKLGQRLYQKHGHLQHEHQYIRQKMREMGRFLHNINSIDKSCRTLTESLDPSKFQTIVQAARSTGQYDPTSNTYKSPSMALKIGHTLKKCIQIVKGSALETDNTAEISRCERLQELLEHHWNHEISATAIRTLSDRKYNKPLLLPLSQDLQLLSVYVEKRLCELSSLVSSSVTAESWSEFAKAVLCKVLLFNRRRSGEVERLTLSSYQKVSIAGHEQSIASLTPLERELASSLWRVEIRGKRGRRVPLLFTREMKASMDLLIQKRAEICALQGNDLVFCRPGKTQTPLRGCDALRKYAVNCGASQPGFLTSTSLRKHIATISQILNFKKNELDILANFMGHDINVHREFYRLPENVLQVAKVSKLLLALEKGDPITASSLDHVTVGPDGKS